MIISKIGPNWSRTALFFLGTVLIPFLISGVSLAFEENLIAAWTLDDGAGNAVKDITGNHKDGKINGGAKWVDGTFGKALQFDTKTHVQIPFNKKFQVLNEGDFTFTLWFKTEELPTKRGIWIAGFQQDDLGGTGRTWFGLQRDTNNMYCFIGGGDTVGPPPELNQWRHFAVVITEKGATDELQVYSDGKPELPGSQRGVETNEGDYLIGCHKNRNAVNCWDGVIDEALIFNKALTEKEIGQLIDTGIEKILAVDSRGKLAVKWGQLKAKN